MQLRKAPRLQGGFTWLPPTKMEIVSDELETDKQHESVSSRAGSASDLQDATSLTLPIASYASFQAPQGTKNLPDARFQLPGREVEARLAYPLPAEAATDQLQEQSRNEGTREREEPLTAY